MTAADLRVSVVVPTLDAGDDLARLVSSLDRQTLSPDEFELVLVDGGSTDGTEHGIDQFALLRPNVRAAHAPALGEAGQPRSLGLGLARGRYVCFLGQEDVLGREALQHMTAYADEHHSDVLLARTLDDRGTPAAPTLFAGNRPRIEASWPPLWDLGAVRGLVRREILQGSAVRYLDATDPFGELAFFVDASLAAGTVSVIGDYACIHGSARRSPDVRAVEPDTRRTIVEHMLDAIEAHVPPGPDRDELTALCSDHVLAELADLSQTEPPAHPDVLQAAVDVFASRAVRAVRASGREVLPARRVLAFLLREGRTDDFRRLARALTAVSADQIGRAHV